jgi:hypothetical protein
MFHIRGRSGEESQIEFIQGTILRDLGLSRQGIEDDSRNEKVFELCKSLVKEECEPF